MFAKGEGIAGNTSKALVERLVGHGRRSAAVDSPQHRTTQAPTIHMATAAGHAFALTNDVIRIIQWN
jgi:hypothetical protein